jgi:hypothetical protein
LNAPGVTAPFLAAVILLGVAGVAKAVHPDDTATALAGAGVGVGRGWVRAGALAEVVLAFAALARPGPLTGSLVAAAYLAFAAFVALALSKGWALESCGCFGRPDTPPTRAHAVLNATAAVSAAWWAGTVPAGGGAGSLWRLFVHSPWKGGPLALTTLVIAGLAYLVWTNPIPAARQ